MTEVGMLWHRLRLALKLVQRSLLRRARDDQDLDDEIRFHLAQETELRAERGASIEDAARDARRAFGSVALAKENTRGVWVPISVEQIVQDLRFGCRIMTKSPALSATAVTLVALVIGGNTTIFSMAHGILTKPAAGVQATGLVTLKWVADDGRIETGTSYANYRDFVDQATTLRSLTGFDHDRFTLTHEDGSHAVWGALVTASHLATLGVPIIKGRSFSEDESRLAASGLEAVISHRAWQDFFQGGENVVGQPIVLSGHPATVVGVAAPPFRGAVLGAPPADVWLALVSFSRVGGRSNSLQDRSTFAVSMIGRLMPGTSLVQARAELTGIWTRLQKSYPEVPRTFTVTVVPYSGVAGGNSLVATRGDAFLGIFSIVTLLTLIIVCANVANLLVGRAVIRQREIALRRALGASRVRIVRILLAEGLAISAVSWVAACLFAWWVARAAAGVIAPGSDGQGVPLDFTPDWTVAGYAMALAVVAMIAFSVAPAVRAWRQDLLPWLKAGEQGAVRGRSRLSNGLVVVQLAFSVLLLTSAGLAYRSLFLVGTIDLGFQTRNLLLVTVNTAGSAISPDANAALLDRVRERLRGVPGVGRVTYARLPPRESGWSSTSVRSTASVDPVSAQRNYVGLDYFQVLGVSPVAGREFIDRQSPRAIRSAIINKELAEALWPGRPAVGRTLWVGRGRDAENADATSQEFEVVGVTPNGYFSGFRRDRRNFLFLSAQEEPAPPGETTFYVRFSGALDAIAPAIARGLRDADARTPIVYLRTMDTQLDNMIWPVRVLTMFLVLFAGGSLLLAGIGQYAVVSFDMRRRVREFGLRIALGASSGQLLTSVVREGLGLTAAGLAIGFALSLATGRGLGGFLYGITPTDSLTYVAVFALLSGASLLACILPAARAARINPIAALRHE
ncbi:MAG: ABC transporter permease [Acidobacteria bacterium]|nr:ABC transporter permease [Acidobacteriota bacterium]